LKQSSYFIAADAPSSDILATQIVLALKGKYPGVESYGICGESMRRSKVAEIYAIESLMSDSFRRQESLAAGVIKEQINRSRPDVAIFVGYSPFLSRIASYVNLHKIPTILYNPPYIESWPEKRILDLKASVTKVLGILPNNKKFEEYGFDYRYVGSPHNERVSKVMVRPEMFGLSADDLIISYLPGTRSSYFYPIFRSIMKVHAVMKSSFPNAKFLLPLPERIQLRDLLDKKLVLPQQILKEGGNTFVDQIKLVNGMSLETLALSRVAITPPVTTSLEAALLGVPHIILDPFLNDKTRQQSIVNKILETNLIRSFSTSASSGAAADYLKQLITKDDLRKTLQGKFLELRDAMGDFLPEEIADTVGEFTKWQTGKRRRTIG
jgi:lipid A disaccharide synthetase